MTPRPIAGLAASLLVLGGCMVAEFATGRPGTDLTPVQKDVSKQEIEMITGDPHRCWNNDEGIEYCLYEVDAGRDSQPMAALGWLTIDIVTLGMMEFVGLGNDTQEKKDAFYGGAETTRLIVSYGETKHALGLFGEFDALPRDGLPARD